MIPVPEDALRALAESFGTRPEDLTFLGGGREDSDGIVYTYPQNGQERVLKVLAVPASEVDTADTMAQIQERLKFARFLGDHGVEIVFPIPRENGELLAAYPSGEQTFIAYRMPKIRGEHPQHNQWSAAVYQAWGKTVGRLHRVTQRYPTWRGLPVGGKTLLSWENELQSFYGYTQDEALKEQWLRMREQLECLPIARDCFGFIHNDPHENNLLVDGERIILLDFDVAHYHWFAMDIMIAMQGLLFERAGGLHRPLADPAPLRCFLAEFMRGYETENHLDPAWLERIDLFIQYRRLLLYTVLQGWLNTQPDVKASWWQMILANPPVLNS